MNGDRVMHATYGLGVIAEVNERHTVIDFDMHGRRKFVTGIVVLDATNEPAPTRFKPLPRMSRHPRSLLEQSTTAVGYENASGQTVVRPTNLSGNLPGQRVYVLKCGKCGHHYGANGCDIHIRRCPACDGGQPGLAF